MNRTLVAAALLAAASPGCTAGGSLAEPPVEGPHEHDLRIVGGVVMGRHVIDVTAESWRVGTPRCPLRADRPSLSDCQPDGAEEVEIESITCEPKGACGGFQLTSAARWDKRAQASTMGTSSQREVTVRVRATFDGVPVDAVERVVFPTPPGGLVLRSGAPREAPALEGLVAFVGTQLRVCSSDELSRDVTVAVDGDEPWDLGTLRGRECLSWAPARPGKVRFVGSAVLGVGTTLDVDVVDGSSLAGARAYGACGEGRGTVVGQDGVWFAVVGTLHDGRSGWIGSDRLRLRTPSGRVFQAPPFGQAGAWFRDVPPGPATLDVSSGDARLELPVAIATECPAS